MDINFEDNWIKNFENEENEYKQFYNENVEIIEIFFIYLNNDEIYHIKNFKEYIANSTLKYERIISLLKENQINFESKHKVISILNYQIDIISENIKKMVSYDLNPGTLYSIKNIKDIKFEKTVSILQDLNSVFFILKKNDDNNKNKLTRRIYLNSNTKKTKRK